MANSFQKESFTYSEKESFRDLPKELLEKSTTWRIVKPGWFHNPHSKQLCITTTSDLLKEEQGSFKEYNVIWCRIQNSVIPTVLRQTHELVALGPSLPLEVGTVTRHAATAATWSRWHKKDDQYQQQHQGGLGGQMSGALTLVTHLLSSCSELSMCMSILNWPGPLVMFVSSNHPLFISVWKHRSNNKLLHNTMLIAKEHWNHSKGDVEALNAPYCLEQIIHSNPFHSPYIGFCFIGATTLPKQVETYPLTFMANSFVVGPLETMRHVSKLAQGMFSSVTPNLKVDPMYFFNSKLQQVYNLTTASTTTSRSFSESNICKTTGAIESTLKEIQSLRKGGSIVQAWRTLKPFVDDALKKPDVPPLSTTGPPYRLTPSIFWQEAMILTTLKGEYDYGRQVLERCQDYDSETYELAGHCSKFLAVCMRVAIPSFKLFRNLAVHLTKPTTTVNGNLSIVRYHNNHYLATARIINWVNHKCHHRRNILVNENVVLELDQHFRILRQDPLVDLIDRPKKPTGWEGLEDVRLIDTTNQSSGMFEFMCTVFDHEGGSHPQMARGFALFRGTHWQVVSLQPLKRLDPKGEKNWLAFRPPVSKEGDLLMIYHWYPRFHILQLYADGTHNTKIKETVDRHGSFHQGSCPPIWIPSERKWLALIHLSWDVFYHRLVWLHETTFQIVGWGKLMYWETLNIEYTCGMILDHTGKTLIFSFGLGDSSSHICTMALDEVIAQTF